MAADEAQHFPAAGLDALPPDAMAHRAEDVGVTKAALPASKLLPLAVLAGAFIGLGAVFATTVTAGNAEMAFGVTRLLAGLTFSLGLVLVVVAGAELFTGNNLIVMAWAGRRVATARLLWVWTLVYLGNFAGAIATAGLVYLARQYELGGGAVGEQALAVGVAKTSLGFGQAIVLGALCNALVCLAVWLTYSARTTADKILAVVPPIAAFVAAGFEHSVANMYFIPFALFVKGNAGALASVGGDVDVSSLTWGAFFFDNLVPVTIGNLLGGTLMVGAVYWFVYLRGSIRGRG
jgi:formate transporter